MSLNLATLLRESAKARPDHTAIIIGDVRINYGTIHALAQRFAGALKKLGVQPGEHIALMLPNVPQFTIAYFGGHYAATPIVPLNVLSSGDEVAYFLEDANAVALIVWQGFYEAARAGFDRVDGAKHLVVVNTDPTDLTAPEGCQNFSVIIHGAEPVSDVPATQPDDTAVLLYTSGTTGRPKAAELTHFNLFFNSYYARTRLLPLSQDTVALATLPLFHSFGQTVIHNGVLGLGGTIVLLPRFTPGDALALMSGHKVTMFAGVPTMYFTLLNHPEADSFDLSSLEFCLSGGAAMPVEVMRAFDEKYGVNILEGYGLSETSPIASFNILDRPKKAGSIGLPIWGVEFQLEDADGKIITDAGVPGEICIKGWNVMKGYYRRPEVNAEAIREGWFHTGDIATRDDDGYYFIVDRKKDMIIRGGFNVYPREIEEVLYGHPAIAEAAVVGVPHEKHGEEVKAVVALRSGETLTAEELMAYCKDRVAAYKYPRIVEFMDALPKGATGKILKRELR